MGMLRLSMIGKAAKKTRESHPVCLQSRNSWRPAHVRFCFLRAFALKTSSAGSMSALGDFSPIDCVVGEAGERDLVVAGYVEAKFTQAEISAGLRPAIQDGPTVTVPDLLHQLRGANADVERAETLLVTLIGNYDLVRFLPVANNRSVEVMVVHLKKDVVFGVGVVEHPLQEVALGKHRGKNEGARGRNGSVEDEVPPFASERIFLMLPGAWVIPIRHTARGQRQIQSLGLAGDDFESRRAREPVGGSRGESVGTGGKIEWDTTAYYCQTLTVHDCNFGVGGREGNFQFAGSGF